MSYIENKRFVIPGNFDLIVFTSVFMFFTFNFTKLYELLQAFSTKRFVFEFGVVAIDFFELEILKLLISFKSYEIIELNFDYLFISESYC